MSVIANTDALIIDLRQSRGGSPDAVLFFASYFFDGNEPTLLGTMETRVEKLEQQYWTYAWVPGNRYLDKPVYILVSKRTFSAPEGFASFLQHHGKATVVGEATRGGTHQGLFVRVHPHFAVWVPTSRPVYPVGETRSPLARPIRTGRKVDDKGTAVTPDIATAADAALRTAHIAAIEKLIVRHPDRREGLQSVLSSLQQQTGKLEQ